MAAIELRTAVPGPKSLELMRRRAAAVARGVSHATPVFAARAEGAIVEDVDGNRFIDFAGGIGCSNVGHRADRVVAAIRAQVDRFLHTCFAVAPYGDYVTLAEKLNALAPGDFAKKTILVNSGAEAIENAVKIARCHTRRPAIICFEDAFHGRTIRTSRVSLLAVGDTPPPGEQEFPVRPELVHPCVVAVGDVDVAGRGVFDLRAGFAEGVRAVVDRNRNPFVELARSFTGAAEAVGEGGGGGSGGQGEGGCQSAQRCQCPRHMPVCEHPCRPLLPSLLQPAQLARVYHHFFLWAPVLAA